MVKLLKENVVYDAYGIILDMINEDPWIIYTAEPRDARGLKSYFRKELDDLVYDYKTPEEVVKHVQHAIPFRFYDIAPVPFDIMETYSDMVRVDGKYISVLEYYDLEDYM